MNYSIKELVISAMITETAVSTSMEELNSAMWRGLWKMDKIERVN